MCAKPSKCYIFDGFPRSLEQCTDLQKFIKEPDMVMFFSVPIDVVEKRLIERGKTSGRSDDNEEAIKKRMDTYKKETLPVVDFYKEKDKLLEINADRTIDEVWETVKAKLDDF